MDIALGKSLRKRGMTQADLADRIGVSKGFISEIVSGKKKPSMDTLQKIADVLEMPLDDIYHNRQMPRAIRPAAPAKSQSSLCANFSIDRNVRYGLTIGKYDTAFWRRHPMHTPSPTSIAHALEIATDPAGHDDAARLYAWRTLKSARGQTVNTAALPHVIHARPDTAPTCGPMTAPCRERMLAQAAKHGIIPARGLS